ncbi:J domain-containing protein [Aquimarina celericrescens]|uniref:J domain-containing protein n=1 Tax=Aquimarina celericrescens TaxID=1964542 RepID=A0ABW5AVW6_9FLAO|nr:J domain-containing protein [Aquimarina celericrescens]
MRNYYKDLNINNQASLKDIKKAYRILANKYHPDKNKESDAATKFIEITEAYEVLKNSEERKQYDFLFNEFHKQKGKTTTSAQNYNEKSSKWEQSGKTKAKEYSELNFKDFKKRASIDVNLVSGLLISLIVLLNVVGFGYLLATNFEKFQNNSEYFIKKMLYVIGLSIFAIYLITKKKESSKS